MNDVILLSYIIRFKEGMTFETYHRLLSHINSSEAIQKLNNDYPKKLRDWKILIKLKKH